MDNMNISSLAVGEVVSELSALYGGAIKRNRGILHLPSAFLWGAPGVGKSDAIRQIASKIEETTGKRVNVTDVRLLLFSPVDLRGVPMADKTREFTKWLRPKIFDMDPSEEVINMLFLDELSAAPQSVQAAAYQITLNRTVGEHALPDNTIVIAAGNRVTDRSVAFRMPNALANRLMHFEIKVDFASWKAWAVEHRIHPSVIGYLTFDSNKLYASEIGSDDVAFPTPRSWQFVSDILYAMEGSEMDDVYHMISGCIGKGTAMEFIAWCKHCKDIISPEDVYQGRAKVYPKKPDQLYGLVSALTSYAVRNSSQLTLNEISNCVAYAAGFPKDYAASLFLSLMNIPEMKQQLLKIAAFKTWFKKNQSIFGGDFNV